MALLLSIDYGDGFIATYHRIGIVVVGGDEAITTVTVESYASRQARERPGSECRTQDYDVYVTSLDPVSSSLLGYAYAALLASDDFDGAESDDDNSVVEPGDIPAVRSGLYRWDGTEWVLLIQPAPLEDVRARACMLVDAAAGQAHIRYGQAETLTRKEAQARAWAASGFTGGAPSYIAAEATRLSVDAQDVAEGIIDAADLWEAGKGPEIEAARVGGRAAIAAAADAEGIDAALLAAVEELDGL